MKSVEIPVSPSEYIKLYEDGTIKTNLKDFDGQNYLKPEHNSYEQLLGRMIAQFLFHYSQLKFQPYDEEPMLVNKPKHER